MSDFAVVISYKLPENDNLSTIILDTVDDTRVSGNATITTQPMVNGDEIADHMFKHGKSLALSGSYSLNGSKTTIIDGSGGQLQNFEELFERIQNEAILCTIYKISTKNEKDIRFIQRNNMLLESFTWTEKINSLQYSMNFKQALFTNVVEYEVAISDSLLPNITEPTTTSFTSTLIDWTQIDASVIEILKREGLITTAFINAASSFKSYAISSTVLGAAALIALAIPGVNVAVAIGAAIASAAVWIYGLFDSISNAIARQKYAIEVFDWSDDEATNQKTFQRFDDFINDIHNAFSEINTLIDVYQISTNEPQEAMISIGDEYYIFTFTKNNVSNNYSLSIENIDKSNTKHLATLDAALDNFSQCSSINYLVKTNDNARIYLLHPTTNVDSQPIQGLDNNDLTQYCIAVCHFNPDDFNNLITDIINAHIFKEGAY